MPAIIRGIVQGSTMHRQQATFPPLVFTCGTIVGDALAKTTGSFVLLRVTDNDNAEHNVSLFSHLVYNRDGSPVNIPCSWVTHTQGDYSEEERVILPG